MNASELWKEILNNPATKKNLLKDIEKLAKENNNPAEIHFGTSGWRGEIGSDFTMHNVRILAHAIIEAVKSEDKSILKAIGVNSFNEFKKRGVIVGHDTRILGREFAYEIIGVMQSEGVKCYYAGEATTPEFSAGIVELGAAASINLTPSHNPPNYGGFKLNPSDGGPAPEELTKPIETIANELMKKEREIYLRETTENKANGYYERQLACFLGNLGLSIPRDRKSEFRRQFFLQSGRKLMKVFRTLFSILCYRVTHQIE